MPTPLKRGESVYVEHLIRENYSMPAMQAAPDHYNIGFILSGDRKWISADCIRIGHAGDIGISRPGVYHRNCDISNTPYDRYMLKIKTALFDPVLKIIGEYEMNQLCANYLHFTEQDQRYLHALFEEMLTEYQKNTPASQLVLQGMVYKLFFYIYEHHVPSGADTHVYKPHKIDDRIQEALVYIENHLRENPTLAETAGAVSLSPSHFSRCFKSATGTSYSDYVCEVRLERACILLETETKSINEIAQEVGISNGNYLCNLFKGRFHMTPSAYRKKMHADPDQN